MKVRCSADTDVGLKREINQDAYGLSDPSENQRGGYLLVVCDGMGGHASGEVASQIGVETIRELYARAAEDEHTCEILEQAFFEANRRIYNQGQGTMGTTGVAALLMNDRLYIANVGDSRAYLVRGQRIQQLSRDHSLVAEQVTAGLITAEQARHSNYRNMITRALGYRIEVQVDVFNPLSMRQGDIVILSSDGLHGLVDDEDIADVVRSLPPDQAVQKLIAMANERGGTDNITAAVAVIDEVAQPVDAEETDDGASAGADDETKPRLIASSTARLDDDMYLTIGLASSRSSSGATAGESGASDSPHDTSTVSVPPRWNLGTIGVVSTLLVVVVLGTVAFINPDYIRSLLPAMPASSTEPPLPQGGTGTVPAQVLKTPTVQASTEVVSPTDTLPPSGTGTPHPFDIPTATPAPASP